MDISTMMNVAIVQCRRRRANILMNTSITTNVLTM